MPTLSLLHHPFASLHSHAHSHSHSHAHSYPPSQLSSMPYQSQSIAGSSSGGYPVTSSAFQQMSHPQHHPQQPPQQSSQYPQPYMSASSHHGVTGHPSPMLQYTATGYVPSLYPQGSDSTSTANNGHAVLSDGSTMNGSMAMMYPGFYSHPSNASSSGSMHSSSSMSAPPPSALHADPNASSSMHLFMNQAFVPSYQPQPLGQQVQQGHQVAPSSSSSSAASAVPFYNPMHASSTSAPSASSVPSSSAGAPLSQNSATMLSYPTSIAPSTTSTFMQQLPWLTTANGNANATASMNGYGVALMPSTAPSASYPHSSSSSSSSYSSSAPVSQQQQQQQPSQQQQQQVLSQQQQHQYNNYSQFLSGYPSTLQTPQFVPMMSMPTQSQSTADYIQHQQSLQQHLQQQAQSSQGNVQPALSQPSHVPMLPTLTTEEESMISAITPEPKRAVSSFFMFCTAMRPAFRDRYPNLKSSEITEKIAERWATLPTSERQPFEDRAELDRKRYYDTKERHRREVAALPDHVRKVYQHRMGSDRQRAVPAMFAASGMESGPSMMTSNSMTSISSADATQAQFPDANTGMMSMFSSYPHMQQPPQSFMLHGPGDAGASSNNRKRDRITSDLPLLGPGMDFASSMSAMSAVAALQSASAQGTLLGAKKKKTAAQAASARDPDAPKKPTPVFIYFCMENRDGMKLKFPTLKPAAFQAKMGEAFRALSSAEMERYSSMAHADMQRYLREMAQYREKKGIIGGLRIGTGMLDLACLRRDSASTLHMTNNASGAGSDHSSGNNGPSSS